ncbi:MAG: adenylate/guanylate cyclase domain-containing protein [Leptospirales bacterium]|nr:adenylate/guanylate cyclase domain-containing protein [Leptospirales bacterium]
MWNHSLLKLRLDNLCSFPALQNADIEGFGAVLESLDDWSLFRINPLSFAQRHAIPTAQAVDLFVHSARIGLMDFSYNMICPMCGGREHSHEALDQVESRSFHCTICNIDVDSNLDDQVEVSFSINPAVKSLDIDPYASRENHRRYFFSDNLKRHPDLKAYQAEAIKSFVVLEPEQRKVVELRARPGETYQFLSIDNHSPSILNFGEQLQGIAEQEIEMLDRHFSHPEVQVSGEQLRIGVRNLCGVRRSFLVLKPNFPRLHEILDQHPSEKVPFLTAKMLLNNQSFRDLFRVQTLSKDLNLSVKSLTLLFTDLKGSTEMYDRAGDHTAYQLVQDHFRILTEAVRANNGAIVKTMGDAIMASFSQPLDGLRAAAQMMHSMDDFNGRLRELGYSLGLKIGLNEGPSLAVNSNSAIDYFGQSVNIAARVQGLASAGEIWISESVFQSPGIAELLDERGYQSQRVEATLKGVGGAAIVHRLQKTGGAPQESAAA